ncbi:putative 1,4-beta-D-glucan cellobiohydrolase B [Lachnellula willkommii]|uniref:Glucanase n=1 Tax=Lachnellula willkommii TaxID=215461 RepID=A0A559MB39_9HELO|nr:putative 1,4-beta-D-glucan cellobiohydrolase B [Lachnellula willkommii]
MYSKIALASILLRAAHGQQVGTLTTETHPSLTWQTCTAEGSCTDKAGKVVLDANWRWLHETSGSTNCYTGNTWDATLCPDDATCTTNCAVDGADYTGTYGATASGSSLKLDFVTNGGSSPNIGSRFYLMSDDSTYETFNMLNQEFTFDVDVSALPCGLNGALYMVNMPADGGLSDTNKAGAAYGTGYCDSQCPRDLKFIAGESNSEGWVASNTSANSGVGPRGACCAEMDIWEANSVSSAFTPHSGPSNLTVCDGDACGGTYSASRYAGDTDPDGCDFNSYRQGDKTFYGSGMTVDTTKVMTVVTQFLTDDGTATGTMNEIKRFYVQDGVVIPNSESTIAGIAGNSVNDEYCVDQKQVFNDTDSFNDKGGFKSMTEGMSAGMVLVLSLWDDYYANMLWLDSTYPTDSTADTLGAARGSCDTTSGVPATIESSAASASVTFSNIKTGPINSTFSATGSTKRSTSEDSKAHWRRAASSLW